MSDPIALVTDEDISYEEFLNFLRDYGAMLLNPYEGFDGQLVRDGNDVWIAYDNELRELEPDRIAEAARVLGAQPRVQLILEISRAPGSEGLARPLFFPVANGRGRPVVEARTVALAECLRPRQWW